MADKIAMSLDEIIKSTKKMKLQRGGAAPRREGGKPFHKGGRQANSAGEAKQQKINKGSRGGPVLKDRNHGGIQKSKFYRGGANNTRNQNQILVDRSSRGFDGLNRGRGGLQVPNFSEGPSKVLISNLDYGVTDSDVKELFGELGPLKSASVHYDKSGRSLGTADIVYERKADSLKAIKRYNGVPLDGRPMNIQLAISDVPSVSVKARLAIPPTKPRAPAKNSPRPPAKNFRVNANNTRQSAAGGSRVVSAPQAKGPHGGRRNTKKTPTPTAAELDAEIDAYISSQKTVETSGHPRVQIPDQ